MKTTTLVIGYVQTIFVECNSAYTTIQFASVWIWQWQLFKWLKGELMTVVYNYATKACMVLILFLVHKLFYFSI
jgi:hypothetical protein